MTKAKSIYSKPSNLTLRSYQLEWVSPDTLKLPEKRVRKFCQRTHDHLCAWLTRNTMMLPILIGENNDVVIGYEILEAAIFSGVSKVPVIRIDRLSPTERNRLEIGHYKFASSCEMDETVLREMFIELSREIHFDCYEIGFEIAEFDNIVGEVELCGQDSDIVEEPDSNEAPVSQLDDTWLLDRSKLHHGSATDPSSYATLFRRQKARAVVCDPPYNCKQSGHISTKKNNKHANFVEAAGEKTDKEFTGFLQSFLKNSCEVLCDGGLIIAAMDWRNSLQILTAAENINLLYKNCVIWKKTNAGMGSLYRSQHEFFHVFKHGNAPHVNTIELGKHGRYRSNVVEYAGVNTFRKGREKDLQEHPTVKPTPLIADFILDCSKRNEIILDPFCGSGTIFLACERTGRIGYAIELDGKFVDLAIKRWQEATGKEAVHEATGRTFNDIKNSRCRPLLALPAPHKRSGR